MKNNKKSPNYIFCILSGIITAMGFSFQQYNFLIWFSLIPCFYVLFDLKLGQIRQGFLIMFSYGITFYMSLFIWLWGLFPLDWLGFNNNESIILILIAWLGLSLFEAIFLGLLGVLWCKLSKSSKIGWLYLVLLWIVMEWIQGIGPTGLTWGRISNSQFNNSYIIQSASLLGSLFVSAIIVLANAFIAHYLHNKDKFAYIIAFFTVFILNFGYGYYRINNIKDFDTKIQASVIQANINTSEKWNTNSVENILDTYIELTKIADNNSEDKLDLVVWAETSIPITIINYSEFLNSCYSLSNSINSTILVGAFEEIGNNSYNAIFNISHADENVQTYHKQKLVPFGEYLPFRGFLNKILPNIEDINASGSDIAFGKNKEVIKTQNAVVGNLICFDSIFSEVARQQVLSGAEIIAVETNDSWFNGTTALHQHLSQAVMRAVENNRYVLRSANTGISAIISPTGEILSALEPEVKGYINYEVSLIKDKTLYTELGDIIVFISIILLVFMSILKVLCEYIFVPVLKKLKFFWHMFVR